jgi:formylmethanofuran dehydrogenase subunit E
MKYVSCSQCGNVLPMKKTSVIEHKRVCGVCKQSNSKAIKEG